MAQVAIPVTDGDGAAVIAGGGVGLEVGELITVTAAGVAGFFLHQGTGPFQEGGAHLG